MKADAAPLLGIFEKKMRLEVPLFQRQYVWSREKHWEPLWEDIARKFAEYLDGRKDAPVHFLGAMVLDQKQTPTTHVERRQIIDGQQRLTTLQVFLAAFRDFCADQAVTDLAGECEAFTLNRGMMADPDGDRFKVWPTHGDRPQFKDALSMRSILELTKRYPERGAKKNRPPMIEAYLFFRDKLNDFFIGSNGNRPIAEGVPISTRLEECLQALKNALFVVVIDLEPGDDAQVIFETLNARGEPLLPADLLRNYIFLRAARRGESLQALYDEYWKPFDEPFWRQEIRQGRLKRPRSDLFVQHFLASRRLIDVPIRHLFVEYKFWIERQVPFQSVAEELQTLARNREHLRRLWRPEADDVLHRLAAVLEAFDVKSVYPLLLVLLEAGVADEELERAARAIESYIIRRAVCGMTTKSYTRVFLGVARSVGGEVNGRRVAEELSRLQGEAAEWPSDERFAEAWMTKDAYHQLSGSRVAWLLARLNDALLGWKMERLQISTPLTVEHLLPQQWLTHWVLPDGSKGLTAAELTLLDPGDDRVVLTRRRNTLLHTIGNLTLVTQPLNSAVSNGPWAAKREEIARNSLLPINKPLAELEGWDETAIEARSRDLLNKAVAVWPR